MRGLRDPWLTLFVLLASAAWVGLVSPPAAASTPFPLTAPDAPSVVRWYAADSHSGGPLADARLDQPVRFWRAGLPMDEVVISIETQTGVAVRFWPPDDQNRRARVNLYLNPKSAPPLRNLLEQLSWVLDCELGCTEAEPRAYYLLGPGNTTATVVHLVARAEAEEQRAEKRAEEEEEVRLLAWLDKCKAALALPQKEAVQRYLGVDDLLALDLIVPWRRVAMELIVSLPGDEIQRLLHDDAIVQQCSDLSATQQAALSAALNLTALPKSSRIVLSRWALKLTDRASVTDGPAVSWRGTVRRADSSLLPEARMHLSVAEQVGLRRWLGESISAEEARRLGEEARQRRRQRNEEKRWQEGARWLAAPELSPEVRQRLLETSLHWVPYARYALWQVQEAAAVRTGLNVVSDAYYQRGSDVSGFERLDPNYRRERAAWDLRTAQLLAASSGAPSVDSAPESARKEWETLEAANRAPHDFPLLYWLVLMCRDWGDGSPRVIAKGIYLSGMEWGGGGAFLHFRSTYRRVLAGLRLPDRALAEVEKLETPPLTKVDFSRRPVPQVGFRLDLPEAMRLITLAEDIQWDCAGILISEDPATPLGAARADVRFDSTRALLGAAPVLRLMATLTPAQWAKLGAAGLNCQRDLSSAQQSLPAVREALSQANALRSGRLPPSLADLTLVAVPKPRDEVPGPGTDVSFRYKGEEVGRIWEFRATGDVFEAPRPLPHLVALPSEGPGP